MLGFKGPRKMTVIIPGMNKNHQRVKIATNDNYSSLLGNNLVIDKYNCLIIHNITILM